MGRYTVLTLDNDASKAHSLSCANWRGLGDRWVIEMTTATDYFPLIAAVAKAQAFDLHDNIVRAAMMSPTPHPCVTRYAPLNIRCERPDDGHIEHVNATYDAPSIVVWKDDPYGVHNAARIDDNGQRQESPMSDNAYRAWLDAHTFGGDRAAADEAIDARNRNAEAIAQGRDFLRRQANRRFDAHRYERGFTPADGRDDGADNEHRAGTQ